MLKSMAVRYPFLLFYIIALAFPVILFSYLSILEVYFKTVHGDAYSYVGAFYALQADLVSRYPILFHHRDSILLYLTSYAMMWLAAPFFFFPFAPTASALLVSGLGNGSSAIKTLLSHYKPVRGRLTLKDGIRIYGSILLSIVALAGAFFIWAQVSGNDAMAEQMINTLGLFDVRYFAFGAFTALLLNQGGLLEELGWRGYALPLMLKRYSPLAAALTVGVAWALWHLPREIPMLIAGQQSMLELLGGQVLFIISCGGLSVIASYFVNITGGSVLPAIMWHGMFNYLTAATSQRVEGAVRSEFDTLTPIFWVAAALAILLIAGRDLGHKRRLEILR